MSEHQARFQALPRELFQFDSAVFADRSKFVVRKTQRFPVSGSRQPIRRSRRGHRLRPRALVSSMV